MKIFGLGLSRTGTTSLTNYLNSNGFRIIHYPRSRSQIYEEKNDGATDIPVIKFYKQLDKKFDNCKFIHTVREKEDWLGAIEHYYKKKDARGDRFNAWQLEHREYVYGSVKFNREGFADAYDRHEADIREYFKDRPEDFLVIDIVGGEDTSSLIKFLNLDTEPTLFSKDNKKDRRWDHKIKKS